MNLEQIRQYCISKKGVTESFPFDEQTLVFKVGGKMFLLTDTGEPLAINLKCDPEKALELRERYPAVTPGYHMNKKHWNTVAVDGSVPDRELLEWMDDSYTLAAAGLPAKERKQLGLS